jgi:hypothetical protein
VARSPGGTPETAVVRLLTQRSQVQILPPLPSKWSSSRMMTLRPPSKPKTSSGTRHHVLVDVGVWLAGVWGRHVHYPVASDWLNRQADGLVFCRVTQMGLLRLLSNSAIMRDDSVDRSQAWRLFDQLWSDERVL